MPEETSVRASQILLLEKSARETAVILRAIDNAHVSVVKHCSDVLKFLRTEGSSGTVPRPDLVLLDLRLSRARDGEVLKELKRDPLLKRIPVVVLASSVSYEEIYEAYDLHANAYICKPAKRKDYLRVLRETLHFWLDLARLSRD